MKKALLIGINYTGQNVQLNGCVNDINNIKNILITMMNILMGKYLKQQFLNLKIKKLFT